MKPNSNWCAYVHHLYGIILDLKTNRLINSLWKFNLFLPRGVSMFCFPVIFWCLYISLNSKFHETRNQCFVWHGIEESLKVTWMISDINYLELSQTSQVKGTVLHKTALTSDTCHTLRSPQAPFTFDQLATNSVSHYPFGFENSLEQLTKLRKVLHVP